MRRFIKKVAAFLILELIAVVFIIAAFFASKLAVTIGITDDAEGVSELLITAFVVIIILLELHLD